jgi:hypothetical protein
MYNSDFLNRFEHSVRFSVVQLTFVYQQRLIFVKKRKRMVRVGRYIFSEQKETLTLFPENEKKEKKNICIQIIMLAFASLMTATWFFFL